MTFLKSVFFFPIISDRHIYRDLARVSPSDPLRKGRMDPAALLVI